MLEHTTMLAHRCFSGPTSSLFDEEFECLGALFGVWNGSVFTALGCMIVRYLDGSYLPGGAFHDESLEEYRPSFGKESNPFSFNVIPFVCMAFTSFDMHCNRSVFHVDCSLCCCSACTLNSRMLLLPTKPTLLHRAQGRNPSALCASVQFFIWYCILSLYSIAVVGYLTLAPAPFRTFATITLPMTVWRPL